MEHVPSGSIAFLSVGRGQSTPRESLRERFLFNAPSPSRRVAVSPQRLLQPVLVTFVGNLVGNPPCWQPTLGWQPCWQPTLLATHTGCHTSVRMLLALVAGCAFITSPTRTTQLTPRRGGALLPRALPTAIVGPEAGLEGVLKRSKYDPRREKPDTSLQSVELPTVGRVDGPLVQTLATVCAKLYDHSLYTVFKPVEPVTDALKDKLEQPYELVKKGGQYKEGGNYTADGNYTDGDGANVSGFKIFNKNTTQVVGGKSQNRVFNYERYTRHS